MASTSKERVLHTPQKVNLPRDAVKYHVNDKLPYQSVREAVSLCQTNIHIYDSNLIVSLTDEV